jgi:hypothetical protein
MRIATQDCNPRLGGRSPHPNHFGLLLSFYVNLSEAGYNRIRFELFYDRMPAGFTVRIDEAVFNDPRDLELGEHSVSDIEIVDSALVVYGNPANRRPVNGAMASSPYRIPNAISTNHTAARSSVRHRS